MKTLFYNPLICFGPPYTFDRGNLIESDGIIQDVIKDNNTPIEEEHKKKFDRVIDCSNYIMTPGFINGHVHLNQLLNRAYLDENHIEDLLKKMHGNHYVKTDQDRYWASLLSITEGMESGTTFFSAFATSPGKITEAMEIAGVRGAFTIAKKDTWLGDSHKVQIFSTDQIVEKLYEILENWNFSLIKPIVGAASDRSASEKLLLRLGDLSDKFDTLVSLHAAEGNASVEESIKKRGMSPIKFLSNFPIFNKKLILIHCTTLSNNEIDLCADNGISICHCPVSNVRTGAGMMNLLRMRELGINIFIGTDAASTNNTNNILLESFCAILLHNSMGDQVQSINAEDMFNMLTINAAKAFQMEDKIGQLKKGFYADFSLWPLDQALMQPFTSRHIMNLLLYSGGQVKPQYVYVNGSCIYDKKPINFDLSETIEYLGKYYKKIVEK